MGFFTDRCINPACGHRVRKGSQFCPKCGEASPKGLTQCGSCRAEVRTSSKFCWRCGADLAKVAKPLVFGDRWARRCEDFAVRIDDQDVKGWLTKPLIIEHGTRALLFQAGKYKGELGEGRHDMGGFLKRLNHFLIDLAASVVLVDAGDVTVDLENGGLWSADRFELGAVSRLVFRIRDPDSMFVNLFKSRGRIGLGDLESQLADEVQMLLVGIVAAENAEGLFTSTAAREGIETGLRETIGKTLDRMGLELVQVRFISFVGPHYEELRAKRGELRREEGEADIAIERTRLSQRLREAMTQERMDAFKTDKDFEDFVRQTEHEMGLKGVIRDDEMQRLRERFAFERNRESLLRRIEIEGIVIDERRDQAWKELLADEKLRDERFRGDLERQLAAARTEAEKRNIEREMQRLDHIEKMRQDEQEHLQDMREARDGLDLLERTKNIEQDEADRQQKREAETLAARSKATVEALLSIAEGPAGDRIVQLEALRRRQNMSPEQILALAAEASPAAAQALAARYQADGQLSAERIDQLEKHLVEQRQMSESYADRIERLTQFALSQMGDVAGTRARPVDPRQTVVVPGGGLGSPVVVTSPSAGACRHCHGPLEQGGGFCPKCGKKQ
jgi:hypothetical protein